MGKKIDGLAYLGIADALHVVYLISYLVRSKRNLTMQRANNNHSTAIPRHQGVSPHTKTPPRLTFRQPKCNIGQVAAAGEFYCRKLVWITVAIVLHTVPIVRFLRFVREEQTGSYNYDMATTALRSERPPKRPLTLGATTCFADALSRLHGASNIFKALSADSHPTEKYCAAAPKAAAQYFLAPRTSPRAGFYSHRSAPKVRCRNEIRRAPLQPLAPETEEYIYIYI